MLHKAFKSNAATTHIAKAAAMSLVLLLALTLTATAASADQWIHIKVNENSGEEVSVNLPLSLVGAAAALIPEDVNKEAQIAIDDVDMSWQDLMNFWEEVKSAPEATFVTVQSKDENIEVKKEGNFLLVRTVESTDRGANVNVRFPLAVVDALLSGPEGTLNFEAALYALAEHGEGNLVSVIDGEDTVRIWIDDRETAD